VQAHLSRFPEGTTIRVAVNPADASDVRYDLAASVTNLVVPVAIGAMGLIFTAIGFFAVRRGEIATDAPPPDPMVTAQRKRRDARLVGKIFVPVGILILLIAFLIARADLQMLRTWPQTEGTVVQTRVVLTGSTSPRRGASRGVYDASVTFRYVVNGTPLEGTTTYGSGTTREGAEKRAAQYASGSVHPIWYRPDDPRLFRFDFGSLFHIFVVPAALLGMALVFLTFGVVIWRSIGPAPIDSGPIPEAFDDDEDGRTR
jgi:hypothetical protein